jgi:four helix bundle protein
MRFWLDGNTSDFCEEPETIPVYDSEERTARFGGKVTDFARNIPGSPITDRIINQLGSAATSGGANYVEADDSISKKEFLKCVGTCKNEAGDTKYFLRKGARAVPQSMGSRKAVDRGQEVAPDLKNGEAENKRNDE